MRKLMKGKRKFALLGVFVLVLLAGYTMSKGAPKQNYKVKGVIYELPKSFLLNLVGGQYAKLNVALVLAPKQILALPTASTASSGSAGSEEKGDLPEEPLVRAIVTNAVTNQRPETLLEEGARQQLAHQLLKEIDEQTDLKVEEVLFPDVTVQ